MAKSKREPTFAELEAEYEAARKVRKKDPARWNAAKHAYRQAEHDRNHPFGRSPELGDGTNVPVQPADVGIVSNN